MNLLDASKKATFLFRGVTNSILLNTIHKRRYNLCDTLIIAGTTRSGSTWLAEIVSAHPQAGQIFEPISPTNVRSAKKTGFTFDTFLTPETDWPAGKNFMEKVLRGQILTPWTTSQIPVSKTGKIRFLVVKFVRANLLLGWLTQNFPIKPPALIIRHPCAIIASQLHKEWVPPKRMLLSNPFFANAPKLKQMCEHLDQPEELLTLKWCMRYYAPLSTPAPYPFHLMTYEGLVRDGEEEIQKLFSIWGMSPAKESFACLLQPSKTVTGISQIIRGSDPLSGWNKRLSDDQVKRVLEVVRMFNLDFYTKEFEPDFDRLHRLSNGTEKLTPVS
ncbi:MAG: hypothetical protein AB1568_09360 [Thermodesulfobacteriota bacterium]